MEFEFDKEIDALLRKAKPGVTAAAGGAAVASPHLDADSIAAFAENALPEKAKLLYLGHFADCDSCRKQLSRTVLMNTEAVTADAGTASNTVAAPVAEVSASWLSKLFKTPNLALAMGALVLVFTGFLGYMVFQRQADTRSTVALVSEPEQTHGGPFDSGALSDAPANVSSNAAAVATPPQAPSAAANIGSANTGTSVSGTPEVYSVDGLARRDSLEEKEKQKTNDAKTLAPIGSPDSSAAPAGGAPPPPPVDRVSQPAVGGRAEAKPDPAKLKDEDDARTERSKAGEDRFAREAVPPAMKKDGPSRSGPVTNNTQSQINNQTFDMPVYRSVGGKMFDNKNGAWYDRAYHGQATINVRRSTEEFKRLDGGLRNIANTIGGTVVVVWKEKAYRIQ